jgi:hypothetical protein
MPLKSPLPPLVAQTIEFVGVGPAAMRRLIHKFDYISQGSLRRVNLVAPPVPAWHDLFNQWGFISVSQVSISIRYGNDILLSLKDVLPLHFSIQASVSTSQLPVALVSLASPQVVFTRIQSVAFSAWDQYMPPSVQRGIPSPKSR